RAFSTSVVDLSVPVFILIRGFEYPHTPAVEDNKVILLFTIDHDIEGIVTRVSVRIHTCKLIHVWREYVRRKDLSLEVIEHFLTDGVFTTDVICCFQTYPVST